MALVTDGLFGREDKVQIAIERMQMFCPPEGYYLAFSGGKDSVVIMALAKQAGVKFDAHYNITGIDPPELYYFIRDQHPEVTRHRPEMNMWQLIKKKMIPPTHVMRYCCEVLKENGGKGRHVMTGVRWAESNRRRQRRMNEVCVKSPLRRVLFHPILDWSERDVWEYIKTYNVPYCRLYDEGFTRLGCIGCPMARRKQRERAFARWPRYKAKYLAAFAEVVKARQEKRLDKAYAEKYPQLVKWDTAEQLFEWWMRDRRK